jgi:FtsP/CotA-like multicopper oxidase with cupredoxin domain
MQPMGGMEGIMMQDGRMRMQAAEDVMIFLESEAEVPAGNQTEVVLEVVDKQTNTTMQGAEVIIGIEKGLPMTTMDMIGKMFSAGERGNGTYAFTFNPKSEGYYTVHAHIIPPGKQMHSMMENHADIVIIAG